MPLFEYRCASCAHEFEQLVRTGDTPACPACKGTTLERQLSMISISSEYTRHRSITKAKAKAKVVQRDKDVAQAEYEQKHHDEGH